MQHAENWKIGTAPRREQQNEGLGGSEIRSKLI